MDSPIDMKKLFQTRLEQEARDREELIKGRIRSFNERHRESPSESRLEAENRGKIRTLWES